MTLIPSDIIRSVPVTLIPSDMIYGLFCFNLRKRVPIITLILSDCVLYPLCTCDIVCDKVLLASQEESLGVIKFCDR